MALKCGIIGLPNVGKSTFFNALSSGHAVSANFPFCTIEPNIGIVEVPDQRLEQLTVLVRPKQTLPATISFVDIAGLVKGASEGEGLGNQFLANIREVDAILHVVRCFEDDHIIHVAGGVDGVFDRDVILQELRLADIASLNKKQTKLEKKNKSGNKEAIKEHAIVQRFLGALEAGSQARHVPREESELVYIKQWQLLTEKPVIYIANVDEETIKTGTHSLLDALKAEVDQEGTLLIPVCVALEAQIAALPEREQEEFLAMYNMEEKGLNRVIRSTYALLGLITYFTAGEQEVRAWTIPEGATAPQAAGVIHSDFERGFIKAEVIKLKDYLHFKSSDACKQAGKVSIEGKQYNVKDGDVIYFHCKT